MDRLERTPLDISLWEDLSSQVKAQNDFLSAGSLEIIVAGLKAVAEASKTAAATHAPGPKLSTHSASKFIRLSRSYNNPKLLKEIGLIYLSELQLPSIALQYFERSRHLGNSEKELSTLIETAVVLTQKLDALAKGGVPSHSGITRTQHARPVVADAIRKTDRLLLPSKLCHPATQPSVPKVGRLETMAEATIPATTAECLVEARKALNNRWLNHAQTLLLKANKNPAGQHEMWNLWMDLGMAHYETNSYAGMEAAYEAALEYGRDKVASYFNLALAKHLNQNLENAMVFYHAADTHEPNNPKIWCNLGVLYFQKEQYAHAETALRRAVEARPDYARAWDNLGSALGAQNKLEGALQACQKAVEFNPDCREAHFKLGLIHLGAGREEEAEKSFLQAWKLPFLKPYIYAFIGIIRARAHRFEEAEASIRHAAVRAPDCGLLWMAWNEMGMARFQMNEYDKAVDAYNEALRHKPDEPYILWFNLGVASQTAGDLKGARRFYQQAINLNGRFFDAWLNMGIVLAKLELHSEASRAFRKALEINPNSPRAWYDLGVSLELEGHKEESSDAYAELDKLSLVTAG